MHPTPTLSLRQVISVIWFPFFLATAMSLLFVATLANPAPQGMAIRIEGDLLAAERLQSQLDEAQAGGFEVQPLAAGSSREAVIANEIAAAVPAGENPETFVASAANTMRANYLSQFLPETLNLPVRDILVHAPGDAMGTGVFFYALPIAITGMVSAIILLQLGAWSFRRKQAAIALIGAFTAVITYLIAVWQQVIPASGKSALLLFGTFALVTGIGWTLTGLSKFVKHYFVPIALTWILILGIPTAGVPSSVDALKPA
ncbi:hypothetical protein COCCU_07100 [Corynebacterium occultum]|uniref:ABC-2 family transporter protein n=1 Tax=Corynebacterium occultum TaxID=2675219 RepID=A0A6B8W1F2_9CORY|nr:hypothetical protein [Corynebacterium occultum]QGU07354.1 hypothetical protein COCCU_07100 [Corynebacterium occultum]